VRRTELHRALVERAELAGAQLEWGVRVQRLSAAGVETSEGERRARWLIGADGLGSNVRRWAGLETREVRPRRHRRTGIRRHYRVEPWTDHVEVHWADRSEAYVTPVSSEETGIAILQTGRAFGFDGAIESFPRIADRIRGAEIVSIDRGGGPLWRRARAVHTDRVALLGDAAGYLDAITGEGLALGFHEADAVAEAIVAGDLRRYGRSFRKVSALPFALIRVLLFAERHASLRRRLIGALAAEPEVFGRLLAIHARDLPPSGLGLGGAARLVRGLCTTGALET
jgi:flavin-dependent dehydrogenase